MHGENLKLIIKITYFYFSMATIVTRSPYHVTFYVHFIPCVFKQWIMNKFEEPN